MNGNAADACTRAQDAGYFFGRKFGNGHPVVTKNVTRSLLSTECWGHYQKRGARDRPVRPSHGLARTRSEMMKLAGHKPWEWNAEGNSLRD